jgi:hypothetical protein
MLLLSNKGVANTASRLEMRWLIADRATLA